MQRVPRQVRALDPGGELADAREGRQLSKCLWLDRPVRRSSDMLWNLWKRLSASVLVFPLRLTVIIETEAFEIAQPEP